LLFKKTLSKQITEENKSIGSKDWEIVSTPYGLFYFNKTTNKINDKMSFFSGDNLIKVLQKSTFGLFNTTINNQKFVFYDSFLKEPS